MADWRNPLDAIGAVGAGARNLVSRLDEALHHLEQLVDGVLAMQKELAGIRRDVKALGKGVDGLRGDASHACRGRRNPWRHRVARPAVSRVPEKLNAVEERLGSLTGTLESVDALASRFGRFGRRNRKARGDAEPVPDEVEQALLNAEAVRLEAEASDDRPA